MSSLPVNFHSPVDLLGNDPLTPFASEIMQRAPGHRHLVDHSRATIAKLLSQNPLRLHQGHRVLSRQRTVEPTMFPFADLTLGNAKASLVG
jgi:hypothetical protein